MKTSFLKPNAAQVCIWGMLKTISRPFAVAALVAAGLSLGTMAIAADPIDGQWVTKDRKAVVTIGKCGATLCGKISKFLVTPPDGADQRDINNPNPSLRSRKLMGLPVLTGFKERLGAEHPHTLTTICNIASTLKKLEQFLQRHRRHYQTVRCLAYLPVVLAVVTDHAVPIQLDDPGSERKTCYAIDKNLLGWRASHSRGRNRSAAISRWR